MVFALICGILGVGSGAMLLFVSGYLISKSALQPENIMIVYVPIVSVRAFSIGQAAFLYVEKLISHDFVLKVLEKMRSRLYRILEPQALFLRRSEERRVGKGVDLGGRRIIKKKKNRSNERKKQTVTYSEIVEVERQC